MLTKIIVLSLFGVILFSLGSAMFYLLKDPKKSNRGVKALTWRIGLSLAAFIILMISFQLGYIEPHAALPIQQP